MPDTEEMVSADPGPERVPTQGSGSDGGDERQHPVMAGLEAEADSPGAAEPIDPEQLVGERPAKGSNDNPG